MTRKQNKRIVKNTIILYLRQLMVMLIGLYTIRIVLDAMGIENYGIYSVIVALVSISSFIANSLSSSTQRFFSFALGEKNEEKLKTIFSINLILYVGAAAIAFLLLETVGLWFVKSHLDFPTEKSHEVYFLYQWVIATFLFGLFSVPFSSIIIAHEDMKLFAYLSILEVLLNLLVAFILSNSSGNTLILYGVLMCFVSLLKTLIYIFICFHRYDECQISRKYITLGVLKEIIIFTSWTLFGQITTVIRTHAITVLLNQTFNPTVVASRMIAIQVANKVNLFANNFNTSLYPPIIKSYSSGERDRMYSLVSNGSKLTFFLMWIFALPAILEMENLLKFWLTSVPDEAVLFAQLALVESIVIAISLPLITAARAPGKMKLYELSLGFIQVLLFLISWLLLSIGAPAYTVFIVAIITNIVMFFVRLFLLKHLINLPIVAFLKNVTLPLSKVIIATVSCSFLFSNIYSQGFISSLVSVLFSICSSTLIMFYLGLDKPWQRKVIYLIKTRIIAKVKL